MDDFLKFSTWQVNVRYW